MTLRGYQFHQRCIWLQFIQEEEWRKKEAEWLMKAVAMQKRDEEMCQKMEQLSKVCMWIEFSS